MDSAKIVRDVVDDAEELLVEVSELLEELVGVLNGLAPSSERPENTSIPNYILVVSKNMLSKAKLANMDACYPALAKAIPSGQCGVATPRLHDGIFKLGELNTSLVSNKFIIKSDTERAQLRTLCKEVIADFAIFSILLFNLVGKDGEVFLSVAEYTNKCGISVDVLYGIMLRFLELAEAEPYGYEYISPYYDALMEIDSDFIDACEEANFPLTSDLADKIVAGRLSIPKAQLLLETYIKNVKADVVDDITPLNMLEKLRLG